jgi:hypothetical protein
MGSSMSDTLSLRDEDIETRFTTGPVEAPRLQGADDADAADRDGDDAGDDADAGDAGDAADQADDADGTDA